MAQYGIMKTGDFRLFRLLLIGGALAVVASRIRNRISFKGKVVFITGGSRGLGLALGREFAKEGARIAIVARDAYELQAAKEDLEKRGAEVWSGVCDLRERSQLERAIEEAANHFGGLDLLVNNAGEITVGPLEMMARSDFEDAMDIHFWAPLDAMTAAIPYLRDRRGRIVNIVSIGGKVAIPHLAPYCASKFALAGLSDSFRTELSKEGIQVTSVFPGLMRTGSHLNAWFKGRHREEFTWFSLGAALPVSSIAAVRAARQIVEACRRGQPQLIITRQARLLALGYSVFPNTTARLLGFIDRLLPEAKGGEGGIHSGWDSQSNRTPSVLTRLADQAAEEYNELRSHVPVT